MSYATNFWFNALSGTNYSTNSNGSRRSRRPVRIRYCGAGISKWRGQTYGRGYGQADWCTTTPIKLYATIVASPVGIATKRRINILPLPRPSKKRHSKTLSSGAQKQTARSSSACSVWASRPGKSGDPADILHHICWTSSQGEDVPFLRKSLQSLARERPQLR